MATRTIAIKSPGSDAVLYERNVGSLEELKAEAREIACAHIMPAAISLRFWEFPELRLCAESADGPFFWDCYGGGLDAEGGRKVESQLDWQ